MLGATTRARGPLLVLFRLGGRDFSCVASHAGEHEAVLARELEVVVVGRAGGHASWYALQAQAASCSSVPRRGLGSSTRVIVCYIVRMLTSLKDKLTNRIKAKVLTALDQCKLPKGWRWLDQGEAENYWEVTEPFVCAAASDDGSVLVDVDGVCTDGHATVEAVTAVLARATALKLHGMD